jgi:hypothetical protein
MTGGFGEAPARVPALVSGPGRNRIFADNSNEMWLKRRENTGLPDRSASGGDAA